MNSRRSAVGIEHLAQLAHLAEAAGDVAVDPVGRAEPAEQPRRAGAVVAAEQQVEEDRDAQQPDQRDDVRDGPHAVAPRRCDLLGGTPRYHARRLLVPWSRPLSTVGVMTTIFTRIIEGELPGTFVWRDERCVAFLSINPMAHGHTLVVPIEEVDHWVDASPELVAHLFEVTPRDRRRPARGVRLRPGRRDHRRLRGAAHPHPRHPDAEHEPAELRQRGRVGRPGRVARRRHVDPRRAARARPVRGRRRLTPAATGRTARSPARRR